MSTILTWVFLLVIVHYLIQCLNWVFGLKFGRKQQYYVVNQQPPAPEPPAKKYEPNPEVHLTGDKPFKFNDYHDRSA
jgi:hypothetical protein